MHFFNFTDALLIDIDTELQTTYTDFWLNFGKFQKRCFDAVKICFSQEQKITTGSRLTVLKWPFLTFKAFWLMTF
jgi:hypothetical protein